MSVRVRIPTPLRSATDGAAELSSEAATVSSLIEELERRYPAIRGRLRDESGALRRFVNLYVNGEDVRFLTGLDTNLKSGDELSIAPAVALGQRGSTVPFAPRPAPMTAAALASRAEISKKPALPINASNVPGGTA